MKWIAISGTWRTSDPQIELDVRNVVRNLVTHGSGIVTGGALGVDLFAGEEALVVDPLANSIQICIPTTLERYVAHYRMRAKEGVITEEAAERLISFLEKIYAANPNAIIGDSENTELNQTTYFARNGEIVARADELIAFQVNKSAGTQDAIDKARAKGIPVTVREYTQ